MTLHQIYKNISIANRPEYTDDWQTPRIYVDAVRKVMGSIDLDPASCDKAQRAVKAGAYYTQETDGLAQPWFGKLFINPPYERSLMLRFASKFIEQLPNVQEAVIIVSAKPDTRWFNLYLSHTSAVCFHTGRIRFVYGPAPEAPTEVNPHGTAFFYHGPNVDRFRRVFRQFGPVCKSPAFKAPGWGGSRKGAGRKPGSISATSERQSQPWKALGISMATFYRRKKEGLL